MKKYNRILFLDDMLSKETLVSALDTEELAPKITHCSTVEEALVLLELEKNGPFRFDRVLLDIRIPWPKEDAWERFDKDNAIRNDIERYVTAEFLEKNTTGAEHHSGIIIYKYLVGKGFPQDRIAFLSGHILGEDIPYSALSALSELKAAISDRAVINTPFDAAKERFSKLVADIPDEKSCATLKEQLENILAKDEAAITELFEDGYKEDVKGSEQWALSSAAGNLCFMIEKTFSDNGRTELNKDVDNINDNDNDFFAALRSTGTNVRFFTKRFNKRTDDKPESERLLDWLTDNAADPKDGLSRELREEYYTFRTAALNICDMLIDKYSTKPVSDYADYSCSSSYNDGFWQKTYIENYMTSLDYKSIGGIYNCYKNIGDTVIEKYPPAQFVSTLRMLKDHFEIRTTADSLIRISDTITTLLCMPWEGLPSVNSTADPNIYAAALTMSITRNWKMHNLIKDLKNDHEKDVPQEKAAKVLKFTKIIFALSACMLDGPICTETTDEDGSDIQNTLSSIFDPQDEIRTDDLFERSSICNKIYANLNKSLNIAECDVKKLFAGLGRNPKTKNDIYIKHIYAMFYAGLRYSSCVADDGKKEFFIRYNKINIAPLSKQIANCIYTEISAF